MKKTTTEEGKFWCGIWHITKHGPHTKKERNDDQNRLIKQLEELLSSGYPDAKLGDLASLLGLAYEIGIQTKPGS